VFIDSHCHLADSAFRDDLDQVVARAKEAGLERALTAAGALGGKAAGAGAGGSMFFVMKGAARDAAAGVSAVGAKVLPLAWSAEGVRAW